MPNKDLGTLLDDFRLFHGVTCSDNVQEQTAITKQEILNLILKALPQKKTKPALPVSPEIAWNQALQESEQNIRKVLG